MSTWWLNSELVILDLDPKRLQMAKKMGADMTIMVEKEQSAKEVASRARELLNKAPNKVIECTGAESSINTALYVSTCQVVLRNHSCHII